MNASQPPSTDESFGVADLVKNRAKLLQQTREFFDSRDFFEVQPPCLLPECIVDRWIEPIAVNDPRLNWRDAVADLTTVSGNRSPNAFLQTSPEMAMKQLFAAGSGSIYSIGPAFRASEYGARHHHEFTMLEWYQADAEMKDGVKTLAEFAQQVFQTDSVDIVTYRQMFQCWARFDPFEIKTEDLVHRVAELDESLCQAMASDRDGMLDLILTELIEPRLGRDRPVIVTDYPLSQAALAKPSPVDPCCALRFELFYRGVELANGYDELADSETMQSRHQKVTRQRQVSGMSTLPGPGLLIDLMSQSDFPQCSGVALGFDRMLAVFLSEDLAEVIDLASINPFGW